jgi:acetyl-CoA carboxylase biotin carboxylase subunit
LARADEVGYPLMVKAAAGGGGKGMRLVNAREDLAGALARARSEANAAFGDDAIYMERVISPARHIEFQILADARGRVIHLGERECSLQRRHQKLIEEAPSPALDDELRAKMGEAAVKAAKAAKYVNAGTIEMLLDKDQNFYFLEMNTRLQVEHPVTELVYGVDIVKEQLRIASGRALHLKQEDVKRNGWAIECRITSEDPFNNFLPSTGKIARMTEPTGPGVRVETGVYEGYDVTLFYDPLIAKLVVWGENRAAAIVRMKRALSEFHVMGIATSIPFHIKVMESTNFMLGHFDTRFVEEKIDMERGGAEARAQVAAMVAGLITHERRQHALTITPSADSGCAAWRQRGWRA